MYFDVIYLIVICFGTRYAYRSESDFSKESTKITSRKSKNSAHKANTFRRGNSVVAPTSDLAQAFELPVHINTISSNPFIKGQAVVELFSVHTVQSNKV